MKELYKLYSNPCLKEKINTESKESFGILEKYLAVKNNLQKMHDQTMSLQYSLDEKLNKDTANQERCGDAFTITSKKIIQALKGYSPSEYTSNERDLNYQTDSSPAARANEPKNLDLENSMDFIGKTFRNVKKSIEKPLIPRTSTFIANQIKEDDSNISVDFREEKMDETKEDCPSPFLTPRSTKKDDALERIMKMLDIDCDSTDELDGKNLIELKSSETDLPILRSPFDIAHWDEQYQKYNYYTFFFLVCTLLVLSLLRSTNYVLKSIKMYFDKAILFFWNWIKTSSTKAPTSENHVVLFVLLTPFIILLIIAYSGLSILCFLNRILLLRAPKALVHQLSTKTPMESYYTES